MPLHDLLDPDLIPPADPSEDVDEIQLQDPALIVQHHIFHPTATPTGSSNPPFQLPFRATPSPSDPHTPGVSVERGRETLEPELDEVKPHTTCLVCERARNSAVARDRRCVCEGKQERLSIEGI